MSRLFVICICFLSLAANSWINAQNNDDEAIRRGNTYIDDLLRNMFEENDDYDPYRMDDSVVGFWKKVVFVNVSGEAKLHDGNIKGLSTLHRSGDCILEEDGEKLTVKADLGAGILNFFYSGTAKFMNFGPTISVQGELAYVEVYLEFTVDAKTGKNGKLTKFVIDDMRGMKVWISGLGPINWAVNPIISAVTKIFQRFVRNFMENRVRIYIGHRVPEYQFPVEGGLETETPLTSATPGDTTQTEVSETPTRETATSEDTTQTEVSETPTRETATSEDTTQPEETETPTRETATPVDTTQPEENETTTRETATSEDTTQPEETETPTRETATPEDTTQPEENETTTPDDTTTETETSPTTPEEQEELLK